MISQLFKDFNEFRRYQNGSRDLVQRESGIFVRKGFAASDISEMASLARRYDMRGSFQSWQETLINSIVDGPTLTAAAAATAIPTAARVTLPPGFWQIGKMAKVTAQGRLSCVVTTPGTARFDFRMGSVVVFDSGALNLNVVAKTNVPFWFELVLTCRAQGSGTTANLMGLGSLQSEAIVGSAANTAGSNGSLLCPVGAPAVGGGFDSTAAQQIDFFFTQTVATGSMTIHQFKVESLN